MRESPQLAFRCRIPLQGARLCTHSPFGGMLNSEQIPKGECVRAHGHAAKSEAAPTRALCMLQEHSS